MLLGSEPFPFSDTHRQELAIATALEIDRFLLVDGEYLSWHGPRTIDGIAYAAEVMAGALDRIASARELQR